MEMLGGYFYSAEILGASEHFKLDKNILVSIIRQESAFNRHAIRYEPSWEHLFKVDQFSNALKISLNTEIQLQKFSWGLGQIMGSVARELGYNDNLTDLCHDVGLNLYYTCKKIQSIRDKLERDPQVEEIFACYNGGYGAVLKRGTDGLFPNQKYVDSCLNYYEQSRRINGE